MGFFPCSSPSTVCAFLLNFSVFARPGPKNFILTMIFSDFRAKCSRGFHHPSFASPLVSLGLTSLSLLLLVLVLLSVPGPIKGLYWFSVDAEVSGIGKLTSGVLGWCCESALPLDSLAGAPF